MRHQVNKDLFAYWSDLKGARAAPDRSDIDPIAIRHILADTFILEIDPDCAFPLRLCGARLDALWRREQKGESFVDLWRDEDRRNVAAAVLTVIDGVTPIVAGVRTEAPGEPPLELELLLLPLRHFGKTHSRVLGALAPVYQPEWLGQRRAGPLELISLRIIRAQAPRATTSNYPRFEAEQMRRQRPRLVVYEGDKLR
jgi:hypothetical protein